MKTIDVSQITDIIKEMCMEANYSLSEDMVEALKHSEETEESEVGKKVLGQLLNNLQIANDEQIPICQDTGMAVIFFEIGQDVHFVGGDLENAIHAATESGIPLYAGPNKTSKSAP